MSLVGTGLKWKLGLGKKDLAVLMFLQNGKCDFFGKTIDKTGCVEVENSSGQKRKVIISEIREYVDTEIAKNVVDHKKVEDDSEKIGLLKRLDVVGSKEEKERKKKIRKLQREIEKELEKKIDCVATPTNSFLENKQKLIVLVEGKAGNIHPIDLVSESHPTMEDMEINNALSLHVDLGRDLERRQGQEGFPFEKANIALILIMLLGMAVLIWLSLTQIQLLNTFIEKGVQVAGGAIVPKG